MNIRGFKHEAERVLYEHIACGLERQWPLQNVKTNFILVNICFFRNYHPKIS